MMNSFGQITANLAQLTGVAWLDTASVMITSFAEALKTIVEMEIIKAAVTGEWWKLAAGAAALAAIATKGTLGIMNVAKQQEALSKDWSATIPAQPMAEGGSGIVTRPTLFLAGEAGPERFSFTPTNQIDRQGRSPNNVTIYVTNDFNNVSIRDERDIQQLAEEISDIFVRELERIQ
ncbi:MAG: hypothetical protein Q8R48_08075 [Candidatus Omnitrophota bacterium]|nr:hypothetical protein [Candidatus Omnitrophota bacterium]